MDCKPKNGCEIKTACGESEIMVRFERKNSAEETSEKEYAIDMLYGTATTILLGLVESLFSTQRLVFRDSFIASVLTAE